jgi:hypothetical protein
VLVGIHQPHYLPWLRYFEKIARSDVFIVLDDIQFSKNGWQNRNRIRTANGTALLTVPVRARLGQTLDTIAIDNDHRWQRKHWAALQQSYSRAPHWQRYAASLEEVYAREWETLNELNDFMLTRFLEMLGVDTRIEHAALLAVPGKATERLVNLVKAAGGSAYYSGAYALEAYLNADELEAAGVALVLQEWKAPVYPQVHGGEFVPDLSIVDLLMNCGPESRGILLGGAS